MKSVNELLASIESGNRHEYVHFWGHKGKKGCLSQWHDSPFVVDGITYKTSEHYMMSSKARLFGDKLSAKAIIECNHPKDAQDLGRTVKNFNPQVWDAHKFDIVVQSNIYKFSQNPSILKFLKSTGNKILVETSPIDKIWGVGLHTTDPEASNPYKWKGTNLLGFALMEVRKQLK